MDNVLNSGDILNARYRILHQLGHGGFGRTYLAEDINRFNEPCVLKEFAPQLQGSFAVGKAQELFQREAGVLYRLEHPQIPKFRELFRYQHHDKKHLLLVQDYVEGQTYHTLFNNRSQQGIKFSEAEICQLLFQLLPVLEYIHSMGVIHRDISPDNLILRSSDGLAVLIDFGSIKEVASKAQSQLQLPESIESIPNRKTLTLMGTVLGKSGYAPPEQIDKGIVCAQSDLYGLAATAVVLLTGKEPQELIDPDNYQWYWQEEVSISPKLERVLTTMLSPNLYDRFFSAKEVRQALQDNLALVTHSHPPKRQLTPSKSPRFASKKLLFVVLSSMILLGIYWCLKNKDLANNLANISASFVTSNSSTQTKFPLKQRFSQGERVLIPQTTTIDKELAAAAFAKGNYNQAVSLLENSLKTIPNDPEALIYLNNAQIGQGKSFNIAVSVPIGSAVNIAQEILRGVAQAQTLVNQNGGIDDIPLKVQIINDDDNPRVARKIAANLSKNPDILGVLGHYASDVTLATAEIYRSHQLVTISPTSTSVELTDLSPYLFRVTPSDYMAARALAEYMLYQLRQKNVAVFYSSQSNYSKSLKSEFMTAVTLGGGRIIGEFDLSSANFSAADSLKQAMAAGAEVIMLAANSVCLDKALQVVQVNRQQLSLLGGDDVYNPKTLQVSGELAQDMVLAIPWHIKKDPQAEFVRVSRQLWGAEVNWRSAMAYDAAQALITAINHSPTRLGVQKVLSDPNFSAPGASDQINFLASGDRLKSIELVKIQPNRNKSFRYEFIPIGKQVKSKK